MYLRAFVIALMLTVASGCLSCEFQCHSQNYSHRNAEIVAATEQHRDALEAVISRMKSRGGEKMDDLVAEMEASLGRVVSEIANFRMQPRGGDCVGVFSIKMRVGLSLVIVGAVFVVCKSMELYASWVVKRARRV